MSREIVEGLASALLPDRGKRGVLAMIQFFFDDSGTHSSSDVVVWGGIVGHVQFVSELASNWQKCLDHPCDGKPPIKRFSSYRLLHGIGEFEGYNQGAKDLTRRNFRNVILNAGLTVFSYGLSRAAWDEIVTGELKVGFISPEHTVFGIAVRAACEAAIAEDAQMPVSFVFDQGCAGRIDIQGMFNAALNSIKFDPNLASYGVSAVEGNNALQAADLVAHETYQFFCEHLRTGGSHQPGPHLKQLFEGAHDARAGWMGRDELAVAAQGIRGWLAQTGGKGN